MSIKRELYRAHCFKWQTIINKVVQTCTVSDNLHFLLSRYLKQPQIRLFFICSRVLHWLAAAGGHGGAGRVPLRPLHPRPQRQRQGGLQPRGQEVGQIYCIYNILQKHTFIAILLTSAQPKYPDFQIVNGPVQSCVKTSANSHVSIFILVPTEFVLRWANEIQFLLLLNFYSWSCNNSSETSA